MPPHSFESSMKRNLSYDPIQKKRTDFVVETNGDMRVDTVQDVTPITEQNKVFQNEYRYGNLIGNTQKHHQKVAEIPATLYHDLVEKLGDPKHNLKSWKKWLNDPENRFFRAGGGHI